MKYPDSNEHVTGGIIEGKENTDIKNYEYLIETTVKKFKIVYENKEALNYAKQLIARGDYVKLLFFRKKIIGDGFTIEIDTEKSIK